MTRQEEVPENEIGYVLIGGLILSVAITTLGIVGYYVQSGGFGFDYTTQWQMKGTDFFSYTSGLLSSLLIGQAPVAMMALGIVLLMLTSYARVLTTMILFAFSKNLKYTIISLLVFLILTVTLLTH